MRKGPHCGIIVATTFTIAAVQQLALVLDADNFIKLIIEAVIRFLIDLKHGIKGLACAVRVVKG